MATDSAYRVLARKYRPQTFADLVGQDVLVRILTNAFASGRVAHAFLLTGIRGIGKTTTARIIARGLNCIGADGNGEPTTNPCGECPNCKMILEDRHVDVIEMDAASRTGVDDIRDIIETVHYAPTSARYKIYIIDEVHMLSKNAFNALLKTLEEPPPHVKFIFATTELRKIPVTIISRCQRFDLKRLEVDVLAQHLRAVCDKESVQVDEESLKLIATAAEGSVRDSLSLLDQAIAMSTDAAGNVTINHAAVRDMLGLADHSQVFSLLEQCFAGNAKGAIDALRYIYTNGGDPLLLMQDVLELVHYFTRIKLSAALAQDMHYPETEQQKAKQLAAQLDMAALSRAWQMLLKGLQELKQAPNPMAAAEMLLVRMAYAASLPSPAEVIRSLENQKTGNGSAPTSTPSGGGGTMFAAAPAAPRAQFNLAMKQETVPQTVAVAQPQVLAEANSFLEVVALFRAQKEPLLHGHFMHDMRLVSFEVGRIELRPITHVPADFAARAGRCLSQWTGKRWVINFSQEEGEPTLHEQELQRQQQRLTYLKEHADMKQVLELFPGAEIEHVEWK